jgi:putative sigma-54 modulation protein
MKITIRARDIRWTSDLRKKVERTISFAVDRFSSRIGHVSVHLADLNGPRGGVDKVCQMTAELKGAEPILILEKGGNVLVMVNRAARRLGYRIGNKIDRLRTPGAREYHTSIRAA